MYLVRYRCFCIYIFYFCTTFHCFLFNLYSFNSTFLSHNCLLSYPVASLFQYFNPLDYLLVVGPETHCYSYHFPHLPVIISASSVTFIVILTHSPPLPFIHKQIALATPHSLTHSRLIAHIFSTILVVSTVVIMLVFFSFVFFYIHA